MNAVDEMNQVVIICMAVNFLADTFAVQPPKYEEKKIVDVMFPFL